MSRWWPLVLVLPLLLPAIRGDDVTRQKAYPPDEAIRRMTVADGFQVRLVASEPAVRQPVCIEHDDRGRIWVIQYLQYPNPSGLKRVKVDRFSRTVYDRVPEPPPSGPKGADRITILEPTSDGSPITKTKDFVSDLNLATGLAFGHGGVFVLQVPYLLFYPDRDGDDIPDGDPDVLLRGFGMEDAHSVANSLTWGPDGWLYGCQGSTVTANIRGIEFQQGVWRYHPISHRFELFCEGGGNSWGLDFDRTGHLLYSTNHGGFTMLHGVQGAYYWKQFGKHGALHNPHTFGYFDHVPHQNFTGGHVTVGGVVYQSDAFPESFRNKVIAGDLLGHGVYWHEVTPQGSSFRSRHGGELLRANDPWFAVSDLTIGPDGAVYVADWHDKRMAHPDPDAEWDRDTGRIYRIEPKNARPQPVRDLRKMSSRELVDLLSSRNQWYVRKARRLLADRRDPEVILPLQRLVRESKDDTHALECFWALHVSGGFHEHFALESLQHRSAPIRRWAVRLLGDDGRVSAEQFARLEAMAKSDPDVHVRSQLACTAKRLPPSQGLALAGHLLQRREDVNDPHLPLLLWWAVEQHAIAAREQALALFTRPAAWDAPLIRDAVLPRLVRRYAAEGNEAGFKACRQLLASVPGRVEQQALLTSLDLGLQDRHADVARAVLGIDLWEDGTSDPVRLRLFARLGHRPAHDRALALATDTRTERSLRLAALRVLADAGGAEALPRLLALLDGSEPEDVQLALLDALARYEQDIVAERLLRVHGKSQGRVRSRIVELLLGRKTWALRLLEAVEHGTVEAKEVRPEQFAVTSSYQDEKITRLVRKHWGALQVATPEEKLAEVRRLNNDLRAGSGDALNGRVLFRQHCGICHKLFGEGQAVGPDLTHANRQDRDFLLVSLIDPSAVIRKEYLGYTVHMKDGRVVTGLIVEQSGDRLTLLNANNEKTILSRDRIESLEELPVSLMPEGLLQKLKPQEVRDLFGYLQGKGP